MVEPLSSLPRWVYLGVAAGAVATVGVAATFVVAGRLLPDGSGVTDGGGSGRSDRSDRSSRSTEDIRREEIRAYLDDIDERFTEDADVAGERVAFHLPERDVAVTFDARTFLALERSPTHAILVEHEMPGVALGDRLPFETPEPSPGADADRDANTNTETNTNARVGPGGPRGAGTAGADRLEGRADVAEAAFDVLGLSRGADEAAVRRAYRRRVKEVHPDHGGDEEEFRRVQEAYDTARRHAS